MLLNFNTISDILSISLFDIENKSLLASFQEMSPKGHASLLMPKIKMILDKGGVSFDALKAIAVCVGPGSFTGARIGCATALGLSFAKSIPAVGVSAFQMQAAWAFDQLRNETKILILLKSGLDEWCVQEINSEFGAQQGPFETPLCLNFDDLMKHLRRRSYVLAGDGVSTFLERVPDLERSSLNIQKFPESIFPGAEWIGEVALKLIKKGLFPEVVPLYVKPSYVK